MNFRYYQDDIFNQIIDSNDNVIVQLDTGAGKTPIIAKVAEYYGSFIVIAHRNVLVEQASNTLSKMDVKHDVMASKMTRGRCSIFARRVGKEIIKSDSRLVVSVDTLLSKKKREALQIDMSKNYVCLIDEAHHALEDNKWGLLKGLLPNVRFIGFTATPKRNDGRSLNSIKGGLFDRIIQAEKLKNNSTKILIEEGYLSDFDLYSAKAIATLDGYGGIEIDGDIYDYYKKHAFNKKTLVTCKDIANAIKIKDYFIEKGVRASVIHSYMNRTRINDTLSDYKNGAFNVLCQVDMVGEGFDMPEIEALIILRVVNKMAYRQICGRVLRVSAGKEKAIILDHAGNAMIHGLPDDPINWNIDEGRNKTPDNIACGKCGYMFNINAMECPKCGAALNDAKHLTGFVNKFVVNSMNNLIYMNKEREKLKIEHESRINNEIIYGAGVIDDAFGKTLKWFCSALLSNKISYFDINVFLKKIGDHKSFVYKYFTIKDVISNDNKKALKIYRSNK